MDPLRVPQHHCAQCVPCPIGRIWEHAAILLHDQRESLFPPPPTLFVTSSDLLEFVAQDPAPATSSFLALPPEGWVDLTTVQLGSVWLYYHICALLLLLGSSGHSSICSFLVPVSSSPAPVLGHCWLCVRRCWIVCTVQPCGRGAGRGTGSQ